MKDADYKHRPLVALSTTGKLTPIPPRAPMLGEQETAATKTGAIPRPRIAAQQPTEAELAAAEAAKGSPLTRFLKKLIKKKE